MIIYLVGYSRIFHEAKLCILVFGGVFNLVCCAEDPIVVAGDIYVLYCCHHRFIKINDVATLLKE